MRSTVADRRVARLGWVLLAITIALVVLSFVSCEPEPCDCDQHRESPSTMKRY